MRISEIGKEELDDLLELYTHLHSQDAPLPERSVVECLWSEVQGDARLKYFGAYAGQRLVSSCALSIIPNFTRGCRPYGLIENVVTHGDFRRQGFGTAVMRHALDCAWAAGCYKVMLLTGRKDEGVFRFYEEVGFDRHSKQAFMVRPSPQRCRRSGGGQPAPP